MLHMPRLNVCSLATPSLTFFSGRASEACLETEENTTVTLCVSSGVDTELSPVT